MAEVEDAVGDRVEAPSGWTSQRRDADHRLRPVGGELQARPPACRRCRARPRSARLSKHTPIARRRGAGRPASPGRARSRNIRRRRGRSPAAKPTAMPAPRSPASGPRVPPGPAARVSPPSRCSGDGHRGAIQRPGRSSYQSARRHRVHHIERASRGSALDAGVDVLQPAIPPAQRFLQEADRRLGHGEMRVFVDPGPDDALGRRADAARTRRETAFL